MSEQKKSLQQIAIEVQELFIKEELHPKEVLMILREVESNATVALIIEQLQVLEQQVADDGVIQ